MKETERIAALFEDLFNGDPWIDVQLMGTLQNTSALAAAKKIAPQWNSVWEIVNHLVSWRSEVLQRLQGRVMQTPANNYFTSIADQSEKAWQHTLHSLTDSQQQWMEFLKKSTDEDLEKIPPGNNASYYKLIHGIIQHDAYHLGQIVLLLKQL